LVASLATISCDAEKTSPTDTGNINTTKFTNLQNKDDVLYNLELAYNERNPSEYNKLLDDNFTFIFSEADYNEGGVRFPQWDRTAEVRANAKILDQNLAGDKRSFRSI
jgi:hypothetical protein